MAWANDHAHEMNLASAARLEVGLSAMQDGNVAVAIGALAAIPCADWRMIRTRFPQALGHWTQDARRDVDLSSATRLEMGLTELASGNVAAAMGALMAIPDRDVEEIEFRFPTLNAYIADLGIGLNASPGTSPISARAEHSTPAAYGIAGQRGPDRLDERAAGGRAVLPGRR